MKECYGKNGFHYNVEESFHMGGTTEAPFHGSAMGGKLVSILTLRKRIYMGGAMVGRHGKKLFLF